MSKGKPVTERRMVNKATPFVFNALRLCQERCRFTHELTVGHSIADLVILRATTSLYWPEAPLSIAECAVLSSLRRCGTADVDRIAGDVYMRTDEVRRILLGRLSNWLLVRSVPGGRFRSTTAWISRSEIIAVEAKLTRWRDALAQAVVYRRYADRTFVLLPVENAEVAAQNREAFSEAGVGLLSYDADGVYRVIPSQRTTEHTWHREFAMSRIR